MAVSLKRQRRARLAFRRAAIVERHAPAAILLGAALLPTGSLDDSLQHFAHEDVIPLFAHGIGIAVVQNILAPQLQGIDAHLLGDDIHLRFEGEDDLRTPRRARLGARHLIGVRTESLHIDGRTAIHARQTPPAKHGYLRIGLLRSVGAAAEVNITFHRQQRAIRGDAGLHRDHGRMAMAADQVFPRCSRALT